MGDIGKKIPNASRVVEQNDYKTKITEIENIPSATSLLTAAALNTQRLSIEYLILQT